MFAVVFIIDTAVRYHGVP